MTAVLVSTVAVSALMAAIFLMLPAMSRTTLPLGVLVPRSRAEEPVVVGAVRRFRIGVVVSFVVALVAAALVAPLGPAAPPLAAVFVVLAGSVAAYLIERRRIQAAKSAEGWLDEVPVRITGSVTPDGAVRPRPAFGWYAAAFVVLAAAAAVGVALYDGIPSTIAVHWDAAGLPDRFADKSVLAVFGPILIGVGVLALIVGISFVVRSVPWRRGSGDRPEVAGRIAELQARVTQSLLGRVALIVSVAISVLSVLGWLRPDAGDPNVGIGIVSVALIVVLFGVVVAYAVRLTRGTRSIRAAAAVPGGADGPTAAIHDTVDPRDDDRRWKGGLIYVNAGDPALFVPKRFGAGVTINLGHPGGIAIGVGVILLIVGSVALALLMR